MVDRPPAADQVRGSSTGPTSAAFRAVLVDDDPRFLEMVERQLGELPFAVEVAASCREGWAALAAVEESRPDVVLLDLTLPGMHGLELLRHLRATDRPPRLVILSLHADRFYREACKELGAHGFVAKADLVRELEPTLASVLGPARLDQGG